MAAVRAEVSAITLLGPSTSDTVVRYLAAEFLLEISRRCPPAPAPAPTSSSPTSTNGDIAESIIEAGGLGALWNLCTYPPQMESPIALAALATILGTAAAMSRSATASAAVLALVSDGAVGRLAREHLEPALAVLAACAPEARHQPRGEDGDNAIAFATSTLLALHNLAVNPDPAIHGLFLAVVGVDRGVGTTRTENRSAWNVILSSVEAGADGDAGSAFLEVALLAAGSVCGAPPLPSFGGGGSGVTGADAGTLGNPYFSPSTNVDVDRRTMARILPTYGSRVRRATSVEARTMATSRGLVTWAIALLNGGSADSAAGATTTVAVASKAVTAASQKKNISRAAVRVAWALSRDPGGALAMVSSGALPRVVDIFSAGRAQRNSGGEAGREVGEDAAAGVLLMETIAALLSLEEDRGRRDGVPALSAETAAAMSRAIGELCEIVLEGSGSDDGGSSSTSLGPRSLALLASTAANPRLRRLLVDHPRFAAVLNLLTERHLGSSFSSSSVSMALDA